MGRPEKIRLGDLLIAQKVISQEQLRLGLEQQKKTGRRLGRVLIEQGFASDEQICEAMSRQLNVPHVNLKFYNFNNDLVRRLPEAQARRFRAVILEERRASYLVGMADPTDLFAFDELARLLKRDIEAAVVSEPLLLQTIDRVYRRTEQISGLAKELERDLGDSYIDFGALGANLGAEEAPVVKMLQSVFEDAVQVNASDVHIEPLENRLQIRFRIDGALMPQTQGDSKIAPALALRLKLMAGLDISEKRLPQDGRLMVSVRDQKIDVRMSTMPCQYGETVVLRLLNRKATVQSLDRLGIPDDIRERFSEIIRRSAGMVLVTGPTGSGKTTTLYAALSEIKTIEDKIVTIEDPVEYQLRGITQIPINEKKGLTFARGLRSILRHDPDKIMVGEIRDNETAQIAINSALTGHLVFTTVHANNVLDVLGRFLNMGVEAYQFVSALNCVLAQRLVRNICGHCKRPAKVTRALLEESGLDPALEHTHVFYEGIGCIECGGTGYKGRTAICELLDLSDHIREMILEKRPTSEIKKAAREEGMRFLRESAVERVMEGTTTLREINKVTFVE